MCGIGGQIRFDGGKVQSRTLTRIGTLMEHRGRDDVGYYISNNIGLVHRRLSIIDLTPSGHQPMFTRDKRVGIVFNGEIFNYIELREELIKSGYTFQSNSDTEVILASYVAYGIDFIEKIDGMYALALLDLNDHKLFLVRDRAGIKPLYYYTYPQGIVFASEIKAIVKSGLYSAEIDPAGLCDYIHIQLYTHDRTLFRGIKSVEPGTIMSLDLKDFSLVRKVYWDMPEKETHAEYEEVIEHLRMLISNAVKIWSRSDVPIASYISGGLDSSTVATLAQRYLNRNIQKNLITISSVFPGSRIPDEQPYSDEVAHNIKSEHHRIMLPRKDFVKVHRDLIYVLDMPIAGYASPYRIMSSYVRKHVKVVLTGNGGDELFCGYPKYIAAVLAKEINDGLMGRTLTINARNIKYIKGFENQARQILGRNVFGNEEDIINSIFFRSEHLWKYVRPDIRRLAEGYSVTESMKEMCQTQSSSYLKKLLYLDFKLLLPGLLHVEDRTSMIENLESRTPLLDRSILEFAGSIPEDYFLRDGLKGMIRKAVEPLLPPIVTQNPSKSGIVFPVAEIVDTDLKKLIDRDLGFLDKYGLFTKPAREMLKEHKELINRRILWALWSLGTWLRYFKPDL